MATLWDDLVRLYVVERSETRKSAAAHNLAWG